MPKDRAEGRHSEVNLPPDYYIRDETARVMTMIYVITVRSLQSVSNNTYNNNIIIIIILINHTFRPITFICRPGAPFSDGLSSSPKII